MQYNKRLYGSHSLVGNPDNESRAANLWITQAEGFGREFTRDEIERQHKTEGRETICQHTRFAKGLYYNCLISSSTHNPRFEASNLDRQYNFSGESRFCVWNWKSCWDTESTYGIPISKDLAETVTKSAGYKRRAGGMSIALVRDRSGLKNPEDGRQGSNCLWLDFSELCQQNSINSGELEVKCWWSQDGVIGEEEI